MNRNFQKGVSLVEILLVVMIIGFIVLLITGLPNSLRLIGGSNNESLAMEIAAKKIEDLRSLGYSNISSGPVSDSRLTLLPSGTGLITIESCDPDSDPEICPNGELIKKAIVKIDYKDNDQNKNVTLITLIAQDGLK